MRAETCRRRRDLNQGLREEFRYDALDRLVQSRLNGAVSLELDYDPIGNIRRKSDVCSGTGTCYAYHAARKHAVISVGARSYAYDTNGNMTKRKGTAITWSADNLPLSIVGDGGSRSDFSYGPEGNRWRQVARHGTATETTTYAGGLFEKVTGAGQTKWRHYVLAPGGWRCTFVTATKLPRKRASSRSIISAAPTGWSMQTEMSSLPKVSGLSAPGAGQRGRASQPRPTLRRSRRQRATGSPATKCSTTWTSST